MLPLVLRGVNGRHSHLAFQDEAPLFGLLSNLHCFEDVMEHLPIKSVIEGLSMHALPTLLALSALPSTA